VTEEPERQLEEMQERAKEVDREIDSAEQDWEKTQQEVPSADEDDEPGPLDEENPVGGL
jgi:peptidoglycan hydrolase CwlO-like protein